MTVAARGGRLLAGRSLHEVSGESKAGSEERGRCGVESQGPRGLRDCSVALRVSRRPGM